MRNLRLALLFLMGLSGIHQASAAPGFLVAESVGPKQFLPNNNARGGHQKAINQVKHKFPKSRILSVNLLERRGDSAYRVKTLSESGVIKYVFVDATTGEIFE